MLLMIWGGTVEIIGTEKDIVFWSYQNPIGNDRIREKLSKKMKRNFESIEALKQGNTPESYLEYRDIQGLYEDSSDNDDDEENKDKTTLKNLNFKLRLSKFY